MGEIGEEGVAEGVIAEVLNGATTVGIGVSLANLGVRDCGEAFEQDRPDLAPGKVNKRLVGLNRIGTSRQGGEEKDDQETDSPKAIGSPFPLAV